MRTLVAIATLVAGPAFADCQSEFGFAQAGLEATDYRIAARGDLSQSYGRCQLAGLVLSQSSSLILEFGLISWVGEGFETLLVGAPQGLSLDLRIDNTRMVPQTPDPWMSYYLDLQNRRNFIDVEAVVDWSPETGVLEVAEFQLDLPGENGLRLTSRITGATAEMLPGRLSGFGALTLEGFSLSVENAGYLDGLALGWMLGHLSSLPGDPETVAAATLRELQSLVADWPDDVFPAKSKSALTALIGAGPLPWGRLDVVLADGAITLDRFVNMGMRPNPYSPEAMEAALSGSVIDIHFEPSEAAE